MPCPYPVVLTIKYSHIHHFPCCDRQLGKKFLSHPPRGDGNLGDSRGVSDNNADTFQRLNLNLLDRDATWLPLQKNLKR
jgi:hypothetical protein